MKWHKCLLVLMVIGGLFTIINGIICMTGGQYNRDGVTSERVYAVYSGLRPADIVYGVVCIFIGIFEFVVVNRLQNLQKNGPRSLKTLYIASIVCGVAYCIAVTALTGINAFSGSNLISLLLSVILMVINSVYYSRREELFIY